MEQYGSQGEVTNGATAAADDEDDFDLFGSDDNEDVSASNPSNQDNGTSWTLFTSQILKCVHLAQVALLNL